MPTYLTLDDALFALSMIIDKLDDALSADVIDVDFARAKLADLSDLYKDLADPGFNLG